MQDLTQGPITGHVLRYAAFLFATLLVQTLYFLVDLWFVSGVGSTAVAAVAIAGNLMFLVMGATQALSVGTTTLVAQATGREGPTGAQAPFDQAQSLATVCAVVFCVVAWVGRADFATAFAADEATAAAAVAYLDWFVPALGLQFLMVAMVSALRGAGDVKVASLVQVASVALNILLAPVLIAGWLTGHPFGVAGAGMATFIAVAAACLMLLHSFTRPGAVLRLQPGHWRPDFAAWRRLLAIGLPAGGEFALMAVYLSVIQYLLAGVGPEAQAGFGIGLRVMQAIFLPGLAVSFALAPIAGQNHGAGLAMRVRESFGVGLRLACGLMLAATVLCQWEAEALMRVFTPDPVVVSIGVEFLRIVSWNFVANGVIFSCSGLFQAFGYTLPSLLASATRILAFVLPALWVARQPGFVLSQLWWLSVASVTLQALIVYVWLRRELDRRAPAAVAVA